MGESNPTATLKLLADNGVMVEIGLSSNAQILEVAGTNHPLATYLKSGVPVALATDDQAVARSSMAGEYLRAVQDQHLDYRTLKLMARTSLEKSFVEGASLWSDFKALTAATDCAATATGYYGDTPTRRAPRSCAPARRPLCSGSSSDGSGRSSRRSERVSRAAHTPQVGARGAPSLRG